MGHGVRDLGPHGARAELSSSVLDGPDRIALAIRILVMGPFREPDPLPWRESRVRIGPVSLDLHDAGWVGGEGSRRERGLHAVLALGDLPDGVHPIRFETPGARGRVTLHATPSDGVLRAGRRRTAGRRWTQVRPGSGGVVLAVRSMDGRFASWHWHIAQALADLHWSVRRRGPRGIGGSLVRALRDRHVWADRLLRIVTLPVRRGPPIWLIGERSDTAQDNGRAFFRHVRTEHPERRAWYVIDRGVEDARHVEPFGNVVAYGSWRHRILALHADALVGSHNIDRYLLPAAWAARGFRADLAWRIGSKRVYLKHGVLVSHALGFALRKQGHDIVIAAGEPEAAFMRRTLGYDQQLRTTGMPRYDLLVPQEPGRVIVLMPTWRRYLVPADGSDRTQDTFTDSTYERFFRDLLAHPRLASLLTRHDYTLELYPHYDIERYYHGTRHADPRIRVVSFRDREVREALQACALFVTDHSSVAFDAAYLGRAVIHVPFDEAEFGSGHYARGWFDPDTLGFGPVARTIEELLDHLEAYLANGCVREQVYTDRVDAFFAHRDQGNAERVISQIDALA